MNQLIKRILLVFALVAVAWGRGACEKRYNILFIQSYTAQDTWSKELNEGLERGFKDRKVPVNITTEYLNSRFWSNHYEEDLMRKICRRADEQGVDLIVTANDEAIYSLMTCGDSLPHKVPVVFFAAMFANAEKTKPYNNVTGLTAVHPYETLLQTAQAIFPNRKHIVSLVEDDFWGHISDSLYHKDLEDFILANNEYNTEEFDIMNNSMTDILLEIQLSDIARQSIIIVPYWGLYMPSMTKVSKAPTFTVCGSALFNGVFCTASNNMYKDARKAGNIASQILEGTPPWEIPVEQTESELVFDYSQLKFFGIGKGQLPPGSIVVNEPYMQKYGIWVILTYALVIGLLIILVLRLVRINRRESRRRMKAQTKLLIQSRLVAQRNEFDNVFHSIRDGVVTYDRDLRIHFINKPTFEMLNLPFKMQETGERPYESKPARTIYSIYHNGEDILLPLLKRVNLEGINLKIPENSFMLSLQNDVYFPVSGECVPIFSQNKQTGVALSFRNISDEALQQRFFALAIQDSSIYSWIYDTEKNYFTFSSGFTKRNGFADKRIVLRSEINAKVHPDDLAETNQIFDNTIVKKITDKRLAFRMLNAEKRYEWWEFRISIIPGPTEKSRFNIVGVAQSIQQYKATEEELIAARDKALQADTLKSAFLANMSHEIRTPLNAIVGFSDLLRNIHSFSEEEINMFITTINKNCILLLALINDILDMSRVESGTMDFKFTEQNLPMVMKEIYDSQLLNMPAGVKLVMDLPADDDKTISTDPIRLKQILNNLINNAVKFTSDGSISFGYSGKEEGHTLFFVEDTGKGIPDEDQQRIFERFYKVDSFTQGAGLGLSICQTIVARMHGSISVKSEKDKGTRFEVRLPDHAG